MTRALLIAACIPLLLATACNSAADDDEQDTPTDYELLDACGSLACPEGYMYSGEGPSPYSQGMGCILNALELRTPGRYKIERAHAITNSQSTSIQNILIDDDGTVLVGTESTSGDDANPVRRCDLEMPSYFADCLVETTTSTDLDLPQCLTHSNEWFLSCAEEAVVCE